MKKNIENLSENDELENFIGDHLEIKNFVIHQLLKQAGKDEVFDKKAKACLNISLREKKFIGELDKSYHKKSSPIYGIFSGEFPDFRIKLDQYYTFKKNDFFDFSNQIMEIYKNILKLTITATGGFMLICEYVNNRTKKDLLLILMINNKEGYVIDEKTLTLSDIQNLDIHKVDVACLINLSDWKLISSNKTTDRVTYLSFVKGLKNVSQYFMKFVDVDNRTTSKESTSRLINALHAYLDEHVTEREERIRILDNVHNYCISRVGSNKEILLDDIAKLVNDDNPEYFVDRATDEEFSVSSVISGDKSSLKTLKYISYSDKNIKIEFDNNELDKTIFYDRETGILTFKEIPQGLKNDILDFYSNEK